MTRFRFTTATSLDGFIADPQDSLDWLLSQPIDWSGPMNHGEFMADVGAVVMGGTTYEWILRHRAVPEDAADGNPSSGDGWEYEQPSFVLTHRDLEPAADRVAIVSGQVADLRERLVEAAGVKDVWIVGGGDLATQFARAGMLDEILVSIAPVMLGAGRPLFTGAIDMELVEFARNEAFLCARYEVRGLRG